MQNTSAARLLVGTLALGLLLPTWVACAGAGGQLASKADWSTLYSGEGGVQARLVNESSEAITVRVQDAQGKVLAQAPLPPHDAETVKLPTGSVSVTVRVERDGRSSYSEPKTVDVSAKDAPLEWPFSPPPIE